MRQKEVSIAELWIEFKKAIDNGFMSFTTRKGMIEYILKCRRELKKDKLEFTLNAKVYYPEEPLLCILRIEKPPDW